MPTRSQKKPGESVFADTNLFLRHLTNDVPEQADAVEGLLQKAAAGELVLVSNSMVVAEIVWTCGEATWYIIHGTPTKLAPWGRPSDRLGMFRRSVSRAFVFQEVYAVTCHHSGLRSCHADA